MTAPDNTVQEVRASVLHYLRLYEQEIGRAHV